MKRSEYEDKILRVAARIQERREIRVWAEAYVGAKQRIADGTAGVVEEMYVQQLDEWANHSPLLEVLAKRRPR